MAITGPHPKSTRINVEAAVSTDKLNPYYTKRNLNEKPGSFLKEATMLVYDDILRFQRGPSGYMDAAEIDAFTWTEFEGNVLWFMDELVGMESDWIQDNSPGIVGNTAYGYVQFTVPAVTTLAVQLYENHLDRFNDRKDTRDWSPFGIPPGKEMKTPWFITNLRDRINKGKYDHIIDMNLLNYDEMLALALIHLHWPKSKDSDFVAMGRGDVTASKAIYIRDHHKKKGGADAKTLKRLNITGGGFFQIHYIPSKSLVTKILDLSPVHLLFETIAAEVMDSKYGDNIRKVQKYFGW